MTHLPFGIFDWGVGGLAAVRAILDQLACQHPETRAGGAGAAR